MRDTGNIIFDMFKMRHYLVRITLHFIGFVMGCAVVLSTAAIKLGVGL